MSNQRPSAASPRSGAPAGAAPLHGAVRDWSGRVFKNSYTRGGRRVRLRGWSVKIQHRGRRHTFPLGAVPRAAATEKAYALYRTIVTRGWDAALVQHLGRSSPPSGPDPASGSKTQTR